MSDGSPNAYKILDGISQPLDIQDLSFVELQSLCDELRHFLIDSVSNTGGHIASNLGVVELTLALHKVFETPRDKIIWDVGHQTYIHKILTGRKGRFDSLRQQDGLSGFPKTDESPHDIFNTGHSSTSISAALGMARARDLKGEKHTVAAVIGDGALSGGMALEALNDAGIARTSLLIVLNDNGMSIAPNVGGISRYLNRLRVRPLYYKTRESLQTLIDRKLPKSGKRVRRFLHRIKSALKSFLMPSMFFEDLGFRYFGPIDGHNIKEMIEVFEQARNIKGPVLVHVCTVKGKGYKYAEEKPNVFHGIAPFEVETGAVKKSGAENYSAVFGKKLCELALKNPDIVAITAAMPDGTGLNTFKAEYPKRFYDVGIAEQHAVTLAAGLAAGGVKPVVAIYSTFLQRAYDQILHDVALQNLNVVFAIDRAGIVGDDGETHQGIYDVAYLYTMPHFTLLAPATPEELKLMMDYALQSHQGPIGIRYPRGSGMEIPGVDQPIAFPQGLLLREGKDITMISAGNMLDIALEAAGLLEARNISCDVIHSRFLKPLDESLILHSVRKTHRIITLEDGIQEGGLGSHILKLVHEAEPSCQVRILGFPNKPIEHGDRPYLYRKYGLDSESVKHHALELINLKLR